MPLIQNSRGHLVDLNENIFDVIDQAHTLFNINRFGGKTIFSYSVGDHIMNGLQLCEDDEQRKYFLLHESWEAYIGVDLSSPYKHLFDWYCKREEEYLKWLYEMHGLDYSRYHEMVHEIDSDMLVTEEYYLFEKHSEYNWSKHGKVREIKLWLYGKKDFLKEYERLFSEM